MFADFASYVRALPRVELHLPGSASPETVAGLVENAICASFLDGPAKRVLLAEIAGRAAKPPL